MKPGTQTLDDVVAQARANPARLEVDFDVAVLLVVGVRAEAEVNTDVTVPLASATPGKAATGPTTWVIPIQPRYGGSVGTKLSFGRSVVCDVVLPFAHVSKHHGFFQLSGSDWYAVDVGSKNGTTVDQRPVNLTTPVRITSGCTIRFGTVAAKYLSAAAFVVDLRKRLKAT